MAARFWVAGGTGNWSSTTNWSTTSGGASGAAVPTSSDDVTLDGSGLADCTADTGTINCLSFTVASGYTKNLKCTVNINVFTGGLTLGSAMTFTASTTGGFRMNGASTLTSNGKTCTVLLTFLTAGTYALGDTWTTTGGITISAATVLNSNTLNIAGGTLSGSSTLGGTTAIVFGTTGNMTWNMSGAISNALTINTSGTFTFLQSLSFAGTLTYTAGTVVTTGSLHSSLATCTLNTSGVTWNNATTGFGPTITLNSTFTLSGSLSLIGCTLAGTAGFSTATLILSLSSVTTTLHSGNTHIVTAALKSSGGSGAANLLKSSTAFFSASLNYSGPPSGLDLPYTNFTDIDASGGNTIWAYVTTLLRTVNINNRVAGSYVPQTKGGGFAN
jgi:hypothetical protein